MNKSGSAKDKIIECLLTPLSWLYGAIMWLRNKLFDAGLLSQTEFSIPVVSVGNITVGGTGKTPHVEYLINNLSSRYNIAVLSRGYKRKTRGFILASSKSTPELIGDEPMQIFQKYGMSVKVAVCEKRVKGIKELLKVFPDLNLIILDDAFQHRWVKPKVSILLTDKSCPFYQDRLLPLGRLRENKYAVNRSDIVIVTKCDVKMAPIDFRLVKKELDLMSYQNLFFSRYIYGSLRPVFEDDAPYRAALADLTSDDSVLLVTGIARPRYFVRHFRQYPFSVKVEHYPDHHDFTRTDLEEIQKKFDSLPGVRKIIVTTEKDAVRLSFNPYYPRGLKPFTFYLPIEVAVDDPINNGNFIEDVIKRIDSQTAL